MLIFIVFIFIISGLITLVRAKIPTDIFFHISPRKTFTYQNCQLDKSCWVNNKSQIPYRAPEMLHNMVIINQTFRKP
jgi:hypothetical protein